MWNDLPESCHRSSRLISAYFYWFYLVLLVLSFSTNTGSRSSKSSLTIVLKGSNFSFLSLKILWKSKKFFCCRLFTWGIESLLVSLLLKISDELSISMLLIPKILYFVPVFNANLFADLVFAVRKALSIEIFYKVPFLRVKSSIYAIKYFRSKWGSLFAAHRGKKPD